MSICLCAGAQVLLNRTVIRDRPRHPHRGVMIDTARHYIPLSMLLLNLVRLCLQPQESPSHCPLPLLSPSPLQPLSRLRRHATPLVDCTKRLHHLILFDIVSRLGCDTWVHIQHKLTHMYVVHCTVYVLYLYFHPWCAPPQKFFCLFSFINSFWIAFVSILYPFIFP